MGVILSLQGCMAVGKTTAIEYVKAYHPDIFLSREDNSRVIEEVRQRKLNKNRYEDYLEIQRLWLLNEVRRYEKAKKYDTVLMDFGAEEIEFYTLFYPETIGENWDVKTPLAEELKAVRRCMPDRILFLDAGEETLRSRKRQDETRSREFFEHYMQYLLPLKRQWFKGRADVDVLLTDDLDREEVGAAVLLWAEKQMAAGRRSGGDKFEITI